MMQSFDTLMRDIAPKCPQASEILVVNAVRDALVELCEEARVWAICDEFEIEEGNPQVIFVPPDALLHEFGNVTYQGRELEPKTLNWLDRWDREWRTREADGCPRYFTQDSLQSILIVPAQAHELVTIRAYMKPDQDAQEGPAVVIRKHRLALVDGALSKLLAMPNQSFTNPTTAAWHLQRFDTACGRANSAYLQGEQQAPLRSRPQFF